jgi:hypothetical protein
MREQQEVMHSLVQAQMTKLSFARRANPKEADAKALVTAKRIGLSP